MDDSRALREEAAVCRELAREVKDAASVAMFFDRAAKLEARARAIESGRDQRRLQDGAETRGAKVRRVG